ncbi:MAG: hypothetical protein K0S71_2813 [Clostridia bacterium]|jgi:signal transduction histidine kinase|nr:hypothetical protein [Clostridia bacterium]
MKWKISNQFLVNYLLIFFISIIIGIFAFILMDFANHVISKTLVKNNYTAERLILDDYNKMDTTEVIENGGGVQVIDNNYEVVFSAGLNSFAKDKLTTMEFTEFLMASKSIGIPYSYSIAYNPREKFWLIVTFPTSIRIDFAIVHNRDFTSVDMQHVIGAIVAISLFYLILLAISTVIYSKISSIGIVNPLRKLCNSARRLKEGDYSARVELNLKNEFAELQDIFNEMAEQIEKEIFLRKQSEENRKRLVLDISHDLKNPLASVMGYTELCSSKKDLTKEEQSVYLKIIYENSVRANHLITNLFELSKMESSEFIINKTIVEVCEYIRKEMGMAIPAFDKAGFTYDFDIPEEEIIARLDIEQMNRVFQNLINNAVRYNPKGTNVRVKVLMQGEEILIIFKDNGTGIPKEIAKDIFQPFVRVDTVSRSHTGGTGLGLAIAEKIIVAHGGRISLNTDKNCGCEFIIQVPKI